MTDTDARCLEVFPEWLQTLDDDAVALVGVLEDASVPEAARRHAAAALNYLFKSLDLIPDGIEDLGFLDDAFVVRVASRLALAAAPGAPAEPIGRLAAEASLVADLLGEVYPRLEAYVERLGSAAVRGRSVEDIVRDAGVRASLASDVKGWASSYVVPTFTRDAKNLVKLRSFLQAKLA